VTAVLSTWHGIEHAYIFSTYLTTGVSGTPGLLAQGGALAGGLPITRPDLHFIYNLVETIPLMTAFLRQVRLEQRRGTGRASHRPRRPAAAVLASGGKSPLRPGDAC
jgi:hypothetical protein